jgi:hypothetical protein
LETPSDVFSDPNFHHLRRGPIAFEIRVRRLSILPARRDLGGGDEVGVAVYVPEPSAIALVFLGGGIIVPIATARKESNEIAD